jgi:hypothetical protein
MKEYHQNLSELSFMKINDTINSIYQMGFLNESRGSTLEAQYYYIKGLMIGVSISSMNILNQFLLRIGMLEKKKLNLTVSKQYFTVINNQYNINKKYNKNYKKEMMRNIFIMNYFEFIDFYNKTGNIKKSNEIFEVIERFIQNFEYIRVFKEIGKLKLIKKENEQINLQFFQINYLINKMNNFQKEILLIEDTNEKNKLIIEKIEYVDTIKSKIKFIYPIEEGKIKYFLSQLRMNLKLEGNDELKNKLECLELLNESHKILNFSIPKFTKNTMLDILNSFNKYNDLIYSSYLTSKN